MPNYFRWIPKQLSLKQGLGQRVDWTFQANKSAEQYIADKRRAGHYKRGKTNLVREEHPQQFAATKEELMINTNYGI
jgi:hypothetical protein